MFEAFDTRSILLYSTMDCSSERPFDMYKDYFGLAKDIQSMHRERTSAFEKVIGHLS